MLFLICLLKKLNFICILTNLQFLAYQWNCDQILLDGHSLPISEFRKPEYKSKVSLSHQSYHLGGCVRLPTKKPLTKCAHVNRNKSKQREKYVQWHQSYFRSSPVPQGQTLPPWRYHSRMFSCLQRVLATSTAEPIYFGQFEIIKKKTFKEPTLMFFLFFDISNITGNECNLLFVIERFSWCLSNCLMNGTIFFFWWMNHRTIWCMGQRNVTE